MIKTLIMLQKISISDKCCSSEHSVHQRNLKKFYSAVFNIIIIINVFEQQISILEWFLKDHVTLKTEVMMLKIQFWNQRNKLHFKIYSNRNVISNSKNISQYYCFCCILDQINAALVSWRDFFKKHYILLNLSFCE